MYVGEKGERQCEELDVDRPRRNFGRLEAAIGPRLVVESHHLDVFRNLGSCAYVVGEMLAMVIFDRDGRKEVRARDVVPTLANLHATPERVVV